ncbi:hypothetical protein PYW07_010650 [Mythimna separata]|uniref:Uncharacterized protein n=1 Tax=Mythimna separata TaxID=271217 RepID=A0AAD8DMI1_MYTSE|nr:hypothetical protein PYW07_010650 [Mythimna separata]
MDLHMGHSDPFPTQVFEILFNTKRHDSTDRPRRPFLEMSTETPRHKHRMFTLLHNRPYFPFSERRTGVWQYPRETTLTPAVERTSTTRRPWSDGPWRPTTTVGPATTIHLVNNSSGLEKCLWVALGGIAVLILMAFFMKLGKPIRRVRRHLSNTRTSPANSDGNLDMGSHVRLVDMYERGAGAACPDPPPPYTECVTSQGDEEPPPRYSASFDDYKHVEPQVHGLQQKDNAENELSENGVKVETVPCNDSDDITAGKTTVLVFDNGRIVERLKLNRNANNSETGVERNVDVEEESIASNLLLRSRV